MTLELIQVDAIEVNRGQNGMADYGVIEVGSERRGGRQRLSDPARV